MTTGRVEQTSAAAPTPQPAPRRALPPTQQGSTNAAAHLLLGVHHVIGARAVSPGRPSGSRELDIGSRSAISVASVKAPSLPNIRRSGSGARICEVSVDRPTVAMADTVSRTTCRGGKVVTGLSPITPIVDSRT